MVLNNIIIFSSWGSGANPWGPDKDDQFSTPNHYDGMLEVVGVTGVVHLGQIQSGIRTAMRIAQVIIKSCPYLSLDIILTYSINFNHRAVISRYT